VIKDGKDGKDGKGGKGGKGGKDAESRNRRVVALTPTGRGLAAFVQGNW
jgi:hypothetical protein